MQWQWIYDNEYVYEGQMQKAMYPLRVQEQGNPQINFSLKGLRLKVASSFFTLYVKIHA